MSTSTPDPRKVESTKNNHAEDAHSDPSYAEHSHSAHSHSTHDHSHVHHGEAQSHLLKIALGITFAFMLVEVVGGLLANSLALIADAGHMLTDSAALAMALAAFWISRKPADPKRSYGYQRFQVLAAFMNGVALIGIVVWIAIEAVQRFFEPRDVQGTTMLAIAVLGLMVNIVVFFILHAGDKNNLNIRGATLHVLGDLLGSVAAIVAGAVIIWTGWNPIDPILSLLVAALIIKSAITLIRASVHILLEGVPPWLNIDDLKTELHDNIPEVNDVHHVHVWSLTERDTIMTLHANIDDRADGDAVLLKLNDYLKKHYGISHSTIQLERGVCPER